VSVRTNLRVNGSVLRSGRLADYLSGHAQEADSGVSQIVLAGGDLVDNHEVKFGCLPILRRETTGARRMVGRYEFYLAATAKDDEGFVDYGMLVQCGFVERATDAHDLRPIHSRSRHSH
jgi:hypothetical protein